MRTLTQTEQFVILILRQRRRHDMRRHAVRIFRLTVVKLVFRHDFYRPYPFLLQYAYPYLPAPYIFFDQYLPVMTESAPPRLREISGCLYTTDADRRPLA